MNNELNMLLKELEKTQKDFWNISRETANFINMLIKIGNYKKALEVGTSNGYSGLWIADALMVTGGHLTTIEFWDKRQSIAREYFKRFGFDKIITPLLGSACDLLEEFTGEIDFAFIDANKSEYLKYYELIDKHLVSGGVLTADNILSHPEKVQPFVDAIKNNPAYQVEILDLPAGLLVAYKK